MEESARYIQGRIKPEIVYFSQIFILYAIIGTSIYNITFKQDNNQFWIGLLCASMGYILPAPTPKQLPFRNPTSHHEPITEEYFDNQIP